MQTKTEKIPECCKPKKNGIKAGILSGIIPHSGCIAIILFSLLGITLFNGFFIKFLSNKYYIYILFAFSLFIATFAGFIYIRRFEDRKLKRHWRYLTILFSSVIVINLLMIYFIFPLTAKTIYNQQIEGDMIRLDFSELPCSGHIPLVVS